MINKRRLYFLCFCCLFVVVVYYAFNLIFLYKIYKESVVENLTIEARIQQEVKYLEPIYFNVNPKVNNLKLKLINNFQHQNYDSKTIWELTNNWTNYKNGIYDPNSPFIGKVLKAMTYEPLFNATNAAKGTQLKLQLYFNSSQNVLFKPQWYSRNTIIDGAVYAGKDRHNAEIYSFYLAAILSIPWTPLVVGRKINLTDIYTKGDYYLKKSMFVKDINNITRYCLYGKCFYCNKDEYVCGDKQNLVEGAIILIIQGKFKKERSPWQRTYKNNIKAKWENNMNFCNALIKNFDRSKLLDLIDASIFDFLIQNGDRHHYEIFKGRIMLLDNGKSFGNPNKYFIDILAPLYQCCILRNNTWNNLLTVSGGSLTNLIDDISKNDVLSDILIDSHKKAIEERLILVYATVNYCIKTFGKNYVLI